MEWVLKMSYRMGIKKRTCITPKDKKSVMDRKNKIKEQLWLKLGIKVDEVRQGAGTSNDGNTGYSL